MRSMQAVANAMIGALLGAAAPEGVIRTLGDRLQNVARKAPFTSPEMMANRWAELVLIFNSAVFGTDDQTRWERTKAPEWAKVAGAILADEIKVPGA